MKKIKSFSEEKKSFVGFVKSLSVKNGYENIIENKGEVGSCQKQPIIMNRKLFVDPSFSGKTYLVMKKMEKSVDVGLCIIKMSQEQFLRRYP